MKSSSLGVATVMVVDRPSILKLVTFEEYVRASEYLAKSNLVPKDYQGNPANIFLALQYGAEVGLYPMQALQSIAVIGGKPSLYGDAGLAIVQSHPAFVSIKETDDPETKTATCTIVRDGWEPVTRQFSQSDAERVQVYEGGSQRALASRTMWRNYPVRMRQMRARWWAMRDCFADALKGIMGREELEGGGEVNGNGTTAPDTLGGEPENPFMPQRVSLGEITEPIIDTAVAGPAEGNPPPPTSDEPEQLMLVGDSKKSTEFELHGQRFSTKGMTRDQMNESFGLVGAINTKKKGRANEVLHDEFSVPTRADLTKEQADKYIQRLKDVLETLNRGTA